MTEKIIINSSGTKRWYKNNKLLRMELANGKKFWFISGYPFAIMKDNLVVAIGCEQKRTIAEWDEWFAGTEEFQHSRDSKKFKKLLKLWAQFKKECREISND